MEKKDIALNQLKGAAKHYKDEDYICCITLAGAAEEILGKIAKKRKNKNQFDFEVEYLKGIYNYLIGNIPEDKEIKSKINNVKNALKHNDSGENEWVSADFENEAVLLFVKAVKNYFDAYDEMPKDRTIINLFDFLTL